MGKLLALTAHIRVDTARTHPNPRSTAQVKDLFLEKNSPPKTGEKGPPGATLPAAEFDQTEMTIVSAERIVADPDKTA